MELLILISVSLLISILGAVPMGLVNLSVLETSCRNGLPSAMKMAVGASFVEILFVLVALLAGSVISTAIKNIGWVQWLFVAVPVLTGFYFLVKKNQFEAERNITRNEFLRGAMLNLISIQVLLYWIFVVALVTQNYYSFSGFFTILLIIAIVWFGKMMVLWGYAKLSRVVLEKFRFLSARINWLIGLILIVTGILQYLNF